MLKKLKKSLRRIFNYETWLTLGAKFRRQKGTQKPTSKSSYIISLTSIPSRMHTVHVVIESLLTQKYKPEHVILWLSEFDRNGNKIFDRDQLPTLLKKQMKRGLLVNFCDDIRSYRKLLPSMKQYPNSHIVTADDDIIYPSDWLARLVSVHEKHPECVVCYRGVKITFDQNKKLSPYLNWPEFTNKYQPSFDLFPQGGEGTIYPVGTFNQNAFDKDVFLKICLTADDVWFKAMSLHNNVKCVKITEYHNDFLRVRDSQGENTLHHVNNILGQNDIQINDVFAKYSLISKFKGK